MTRPSNEVLRLRAPEREAEKKNLIKFLLEKCETATQPLDLPKAVNEFKALNGTSTTVGVMLLWVREYRKKIHSMPELESNALAKQVFGLGMRANATLSARLTKDAYVEWSGKAPMTIKKYVANDGSLHLEALPKPRAGQKGMKKRSHTDDGDGEIDTEEETEEEDSSDDELDRPVLEVAKKRTTGRRRHSEVGNRSDVVGHVVKQEAIDETAQAQSTISNPVVRKNQTAQAKPTSGVETDNHQEQQMVPEVPRTRFVSLATHKNLLKSLPTLAEVMDLQMDFKRLKRAVKLMEHQEKHGSNDGPEFKKLKIEDVSCGFHYSIMKAQQCDEVKPDKYARSLKQYLTLLHYIVADSGIEELEKIKQMLKEEIKEIQGRDKMVAVSGISKSIEVVLDILIPKYEN